MANGLTLRAPAPTGAFLDAYTRSLFGGLEARRLQEASDLQSLVRQAQLAKIQRDQEEQAANQRALELSFGPALGGAAPPGNIATGGGGMPSMPSLVSGLPGGQMSAGGPSIGVVPLSQFVSEAGGPANAARIAASSAGQAVMKLRGVVSDAEAEAYRRKAEVKQAVQAIWDEADQLMRDEKPMEAKFRRAAGFRKLADVATDHNDRIANMKASMELEKDAIAVKDDTEYAKTMKTLHERVRGVVRDPCDPGEAAFVVSTLLESKSKVANKEGYGLALKLATGEPTHLVSDQDLCAFNQAMMRRFVTPAATKPGPQDIKADMKAAIIAGASEMFRTDPKGFSRAFPKLITNKMFSDAFEMPRAPESVYEEAQATLTAQGIPPGHPEFPAKSRALVTDLKKERAKAEAEGREAARADRPGKPETAGSLTIALDRLRRERKAVEESDLTEDERAAQLRDLDAARALTVQEYLSASKAKAEARGAAMPPERQRDFDKALTEARKVWSDPALSKKSDEDKKVATRRKLTALKFPSDVVERAVETIAQPAGTVNPEAISQVKDGLARTILGGPYETLDASGKAAIDAEFDRLTSGRAAPSKPAATPAAPTTPTAPSPATPVTAPVADKKAQALRVLGELFPGRTWEQLTPEEKKRVADRVP